MFILYLFLVNRPQGLYVNPSWFKWISGIFISPSDKPTWQQDVKATSQWYVFTTSYWNEGVSRGRKNNVSSVRLREV